MALIHNDIDLEQIKARATNANASMAILDTIRHVLSVSPFIARTAQTVPGFWVDILPILEHPDQPGDLSDRLKRQLDELDDPADFDHLLRGFRRNEIIRIAWRDLCGWADTAETLLDLSTLADVCVQAAHDIHERALIDRFGVPRDDAGGRQGMVILGMGKLGGQELNYSSDIDLIFAFPSEGETDGSKSVANSAFFIRLGQRIIRSLNDVTADGFVFRVDMRLRPHGDEGPLALSFDAIELYYTTVGREWERYALIKARVIAGDRVAGQELMDMLRPFVYRRYLDFGAFAQLREMKLMIQREMTRKGMHDNIKLGPGGIREIEFVGQLFQLLRGGREPALQQRNIITILHELVHLGELPAAVVEDLISGYDFLRRTENRLQMQHDQQTQNLPVAEDDRQRLAMAMGCDSWPDFMLQLDQHRDRIHEHFGDVLRLPEPDKDNKEASRDPLEQLWLDADTASFSEAADVLSATGFHDPEEAWKLLQDWRHRHLPIATPTVVNRLNQLMPALIRAVGSTGSAHVALSRVLDLFSQVLRRSVYLALLIEQPQALHQLVRLCAISPWIAELLSQHPILLDELIDPATLYDPTDKDTLARELDGILERCGSDIERQTDELRRFRQLATLRIAAADVVDALPVMKVSDQLTWVAEVILARVLDICWNQMAQKHGVPTCTVEGKTVEPGFAIIGYGKLGGIELGYGSDLDVVFLHDSTDADAVTNGNKPIENSLFFARLAQKIIHLLSIRTPAGVLYEVDTRLRPDGASGLLVSSMNAFEQYQREHAWLWEYQALCRARFITGNRTIADRFDAIRREIICRERNHDELREGVINMRQKMRNEIKPEPAGLFHLKKGVGGITDIEFLVQYLLLRHAHTHPDVLTFTDNIRQIESLNRAGVLNNDLANGLIESYRTLRDTGHEQILKGETMLVDECRFADERRIVRQAWRQVLGQFPPERSTQTGA